MLVSSDTNIWIDFALVNRINFPFLLKNEYYMSNATFEDEVISPENMKSHLLSLGLKLTDVSETEKNVAFAYKKRYSKLSQYDAFALAIAKHRKWVLLTGDRPLRLAAHKENVEVHGVLWICDLLQEQNKITKQEYYEIINAFKELVTSGKCRLPLSELAKRLIQLD